MGSHSKVVRALRTKETRTPNGTQNFGRPRRSTPTSFVFFWKGERERERFFCCRGKMPAAPPNVDSIRKAVEGSKRSANQSVVMSLRGLELVADDEKYVQDESEMEIPPGVDTPRSFGSFIRYFGPGWLVCIAYVDPGNYQADIQSGAQTGYSQNWVILWTQLLSWYVQYMCVKLQHYTNTNLAEAMALQYPKYVRWMFWVIAEVSIILTDLPEVIGFAIAIHLFNPSVPLYAGVLLSFLTTMLFLATLHKGSYFIELTACALVVIMSIVLFVEWDMSPTNSEDFLKGAFLPILPMTPGAIQSIIQIIGEVGFVGSIYPNSFHDSCELGHCFAGCNLCLREEYSRCRWPRNCLLSKIS